MCYVLYFYFIHGVLFYGHFYFENLQINRKVKSNSTGNAIWPSSGVTGCQHCAPFASNCIVFLNLAKLKIKKNILTNIQSYLNTLTVVWLRLIYIWIGTFWGIFFHHRYKNRTSESIAPNSTLKLWPHRLLCSCGTSSF